MTALPVDRRSWLTVLRRYLGAMALGSLVWEFAHMPFYTLWESATPGGIALAAIHCTGGDVLIAVGALAASLLFFGTDDWPDRGYLRVALLAVAGGLTYTLFSEWLNVEVRQTWAYRDLMPIIPVLDVGLSLALCPMGCTARHRFLVGETSERKVMIRPLRRRWPAVLAVAAMLLATSSVLSLARPAYR